MRRLFFTVLFGLLAAAPATAQVYATPLPPGPGTVPLVLPGGPLVAPILMPLNAPTAAPVGVYNYASPQPVLLSGGSAPPTRRFYVGAEFLYGVAQGDHLPPLVTASPAGTPIGQAGALFNPNTFTSFGDGRANNEFRPGARFHAGYFLDCEHANALELGGFFLGGTNDRFIGSSGPGGIILARPLVNGTNGLNFGLPVAGIVPGGITASADSTVGGFEINYRRTALLDVGARLDGIAGFRYLHLGDSVDVWQAGGGLLANDHFSTRNNFYGAQIGGILSACMGGGFGLEAFAKLALGATAADYDADGTTATLGGAVPIGVLVQPSNAIHQTTHYFSVVPEVGLKLNYAFGERFRVDAGYSFLYWSEVRRAPAQIDLTTASLRGGPRFATTRPTCGFTPSPWGLGWSFKQRLQYSEPRPSGSERHPRSRTVALGRELSGMRCASRSSLLKVTAMTPDPDDIVRVATGSLVEVEAWHEALIAAGYDARVVGDHLTAGLGTAIPGSVELWVHRGSAEAAEELLRREDKRVQDLHAQDEAVREVRSEQPAEPVETLPTQWPPVG